MTTRHLIVMRHAKAEPYAATDHARGLTRRGRRDAADAGDYLAAASIVPDHAVVSTATRTRETWDEVAKASGCSAAALFDRSLYDGGVVEALEVLSLVPEQARTVILVGHNPTVAALAHLLDDGEGDPAANNQMLQGYPTSALSVFDLEGGDWSTVGEGTGRLRHFHVGRG